MRCAGLVLLCAAALMAEGRPPREIAFEGRLSMPARLADGRLISLYAEMRPFTEMEKENAVTPVYRRLSSDHGATWSAPERVFSFAAGKGVFAFQVFPVVDRKGAVHAFAVRYFALANKERSQGHSELFHAVSKDGGSTWTEPARANFGHNYTGAINSIIELKSGRLLGALSYTSDNFIEAVGQREFRVVSFYSDDSGATWKVGQDDMQVPFGPQVVHPGAIEPVLVESAPNQVRMLIRTQTLRFWESVSGDGGATFSKPVASRFMAPDSPGAIARLKNGDLLLVWNDIQAYPNGVTGHYRQYLYGALSRDNGKTWTASKRVGPLEQPDAPRSRGDYPMLCEAADGSVLLYYTRFGLRPAASYVDQHNELVRLDPSWWR
ncbi:MAG: exo-alpha-sialidase [Bryobacterales bacterium]|nr:exo-alpha-sialidase [Bryobacterales bacterium]